MLKLVPKETPAQVLEPEELLDFSSRSPFTSEIQMQGPCLYTMVIQDPSHFLNCELVLEIEKNQDESDSNVVICHFPKISDEILNAFVWEDDTLYAIVMIQFQLKILKQLFLFCATHFASTLIIYSDDDQAEDLEIYRDFLAYEDLDYIPKGDITEMVIPTNINAYEVFSEFMDIITLKFKQSLWQYQRINPAFNHYLKFHPFG
jgi:hypothetical protein